MGNREKERSARQAIKMLIGRPEGDDSVNLFVDHHVSELEADYFTDTYGTPTPEPTQIIESLVLVDSWSSGGDDCINTFDFSLPKNATNDLLSVRFAGEKVHDISMES